MEIVLSVLRLVAVGYMVEFAGVGYLVGFVVGVTVGVTIGLVADSALAARRARRMLADAGFRDRTYVVVTGWAREDADRLVPRWLCWARRSLARLWLPDIADDLIGYRRRKRIRDRLAAIRAARERWRLPVAAVLNLVQHGTAEPAPLADQLADSLIEAPGAPPRPPVALIAA